ncbi:MAG TPA: endonuclease III domain-containing protein [Terriglobia bacterium]|nr:endonuclease III domain-containing protein [Terriglobia bacterium]
MLQSADDDLDRFYQRLLEALGPQGWWPAETRLEVILGTILTQNTSWRNAALALQRLRAAKLLDLARLRAAPEVKLRSLIRPAGFYRQKTRTIRGFLRWLDETHGGSLRRMLGTPAAELRGALLALRGLGPETVDAILLYAAGRPFFVSDAYVRRILVRHDMLTENATYEEAQGFIHRRLKRDPQMYNEFHALLVEIGKRHCKRRAPDCQACPLEEFLPAGRLAVVRAGSSPQPDAL